MSLPAEILEIATGIVEACDEGALASRALMDRSDVSPELGQLLTELRGHMISIRAEGYRLKGSVGAANATGLVEHAKPVPQQEVLLDLPLITDAVPRVATGHPPRHAPVLSGKDLAAGERRSED